MTGAAPPSLSPALEARLRARADEVLAALKAKDTGALAVLVDPVRGVRFSPYSYIDGHDITLTPAQLRNAMKDARLRNWGSADGSGEPIERTFGDYYPKFVWSKDFTKAPRVAVDCGESTGNMADNICQAYPSAHFVELYYPPSDDATGGGLDWVSLRLVFEVAKADASSTLWLVGIVHGQWTI